MKEKIRIGYIGLGRGAIPKSDYSFGRERQGKALYYQ